MAESRSPITLRGDINPWERQDPVESEVMYSRFLVFRDLGPETDRLRQTVEVLSATGDKVSYGTVRGMSSRFRWGPRAAAWDRYILQADRSRMVKLRRDAIDQQRKVAQGLRVKALQALEKIQIEDLSPQDVVRFVKLSFEIEHSIFSEYVATAADSPEGAAAGTAVDIESWSPAERRRRLELLRTELTHRASRAVDDDEVVA
jgi:hypothetical protein